jgi:hypothetical protein
MGLNFTPHVMRWQSVHRWCSICKDLWLLWSIACCIRSSVIGRLQMLCYAHMMKCR